MEIYLQCRCDANMAKYGKIKVGSSSSLNYCQAGCMYSKPVEKNVTKLAFDNALVSQFLLLSVSLFPFVRWQFCCCHFSIWCSFEPLCYFPQDFINTCWKCLFQHDTTLEVFAQISKKKHILLLGNESSMNQKTHLQLVRIIEAVKEWVGSILGIQWRDLTRVSSWWTSYQNIGQNPRVSLTIQSPHQDQKKIQVAFSSSKPKTFDICFHHFHHCTADGVFYTNLSLSKIGSFFPFKWIVV